MKRALIGIVLGLSAATTLAVGSAAADGPPPAAPIPPPAARVDAGATDATITPIAADAARSPGPTPAPAPSTTSTPASQTSALDAAERPMVRARRRAKPRYGAAGCGLGSIIFGPKPGLAQVSAASTNSFGLQTFAITSGTENCDSIDDHETIENFVAMNREALAKDSARGAGETIATLTAIAGCADPVAVGRALKAQFAKIFPSAGAQNERIARAIRALLRADAELGCENLPE